MHIFNNTSLSIRKVLIVILSLLPFAVSAQSTHREYRADSIAFTKAMWQNDTLDGFIYRHYHFQQKEVFNSYQYINVIEIPRGSKAHLAFVSDTTFTRVSEFAQRYQAVAGINGSYYNMSTCSPVCYLRINGVELGENVPSKSDSIHRKYYQNGTIRLLRSGRPRFVLPDSNRLAESKMPDSNIMTAGPMLLQHGAKVPQRLDRKFVYSRHNRTAIGLKADGTIVLFVADGRKKKQADGLSIPELACMMRWLGCTDAVNLDGGGSSTMYIKDYGLNGIVNHPSDNGLFDERGQRPVANAIMVVKGDANKSTEIRK